MNQCSGSAQTLAWRNEADAFLDRGRFKDAIRSYRRVLSIEPELADVWYNLGYALKSDGQFEAALEAYQRALDASVSDPQEVHLNRAVICSTHLNRHAAAEVELRAALDLQPDYQPALLNLGNLHEERGQRTAAADCYRKILDSNHGHDTRHRDEALARLCRLQPPASLDDPLLGQLSHAARHCDDPPTRANLWFALGHACERLQCTDQAFDAFTQANASSRRGAPAYDRKMQERLVKAIMESFAHRVPDRDPQPASPEPLFICGMFRSGSTLLEQALAGHPAIHAGGELEWMPRLVRNELAPFPYAMTDTTPRRMAGLARAYLNHLQKLFPDASGARFITDKRPDNFLLIGLIKWLFPRARIMHTVRHPLDTGLSIFMQHLEPRVTPYATALDDIGHYYVQYRRLMAHWKKLYPDDIHDVDYDALVRAPQEVLEAALGFAGLDWNRACLDFHRLGNTIKTASYWQVRQPLYRDASGRWKRYAGHLGPLKLELERAGMDPQ